MHRQRCTLIRVVPCLCIRLIDRRMECSSGRTTTETDGWMVVWPFGAARRGLEVLTPDQIYMIERPCNRSIRRPSESRWATPLSRPRPPRLLLATS